MPELFNDRRGTSIVAYLLLVPLSILIVIGSIQMWRLISIKQSLHVGTYQTVRCLTMYDSRRSSRAECESLLRAKLRHSGLIDAHAVANLDIAYFRIEDHLEHPINDPTMDLDGCGIPFRMKVRLPLPWTVVIPYLPARELTLHEWKTSYIECPTGWAPISEGTPITPLN